MSDYSDALPDDKQEYFKNYLKKWREEHKDYMKEWYASNKDKFLEKILTPVVCECGFECGKTNLKRHQKTKLHLKKLSKKL